MFFKVLGGSAAKVEEQDRTLIIKLHFIGAKIGDRYSNTAF